jgi:hypothetical protein
MATRKSAKLSEKTSKPFEVDVHFARVVEAFKDDRHVTRGKLMSSYGLKVNGKIFAMFAKGRFVTKLPKARVDALVSSGRGERFAPRPGRLMKEWVVVDPEGADWVALAREAYRFVHSAR